MIRAVWKGTVVAEAPQTVRVEGNNYFPLCCVSPTVLGLLGIISAATTFAWANNLYDNYAWWFRLGGLAVLAALVWLSLRRQRQRSIDGVRPHRKRLLAVIAIAAGTYGVLYAVTTWLGTFA
jgi:hypothetical protein